MFEIQTSWPLLAWWTASAHRDHAAGSDQDLPAQLWQQHDQRDRLRCDREHGEVVRQHRKRRRHRPPSDHPCLPAPQRFREEPEGDSAQQDQQHIGARLLRVPDHRGTRRHERRRGDPGGAGYQPPARPPRDGYHGDAEVRRERPDPDLGVPEELGPGPSQDVVQRRRRLAGGDVAERRSQARCEHASDRHRLVGPEALQPKRRVPERRSEDRDPDDRPDLGAGPDRPADPLSAGRSA